MTEIILANAAPITRLEELDLPGILAGQVSPSTIKMYRRDIEAYRAFAGDNLLSPLAFARWRNELVSAEYSPNTINRMLSAVRKVIKEGATQGFFPKEISAAFEEVKGVQVRALRDRLRPNAKTRITAKQMAKIINQPDTITLAGKMHRAFLMTLSTSGARISEVISLTHGQVIKVEKGYQIRVRGKTDTDYREAPLSRAAYEAIQLWLEARPVESDYIFTGFGGRGSRAPRTEPVTAKSAWKIVQRYTNLAGVPNVKPHDFRRFVGTTLAAKDVKTAQVALGHKDAATTLNHYVLVDLEGGITDNLYDETEE